MTPRHEDVTVGVDVGGTSTRIVVCGPVLSRPSRYGTNALQSDTRSTWNTVARAALGVG